MEAPTSFTFEGKEFTLWTEKQLQAVKRDALKNRCLDLRGHIGADRLPPMPHHPDGMIEWILKVQQLVTNTGGSPDTYEESDAGRPNRSGAPPGGDAGRGGAPTGRQHGRQYEDMNESEQAYVDAKRAGEASRQRNQGGGMAGVFGGQ